MDKPFNKHLSDRLESIFTVLDNGYAAGISMSSSSKGHERELFISTFLEQVLPINRRFSSGDITDSLGLRSGQVDIVLEYPNGYSFPMLIGGPRLFLAENVAAVFEIKSNLINQWQEVLETTKKVKSLTRCYSATVAEELMEEYKDKSFPLKEQFMRDFSKHAEKAKGKGTPNIPVYAVGFTGWKKLESLKEKLKNSDVDGIFVISERHFVGKHGVKSGLPSMLTFLQELEFIFNEDIETSPATIFYNI